MDRVTGAHDVKRGAGAVGIVTAGLVRRQEAYEVLVAYALAPLLKNAHPGGSSDGAGVASASSR